MDLTEFLAKEGEKPLERMASNGGFCGIFRKIACIGDSFASGEFESRMDGKARYHDYYDYSWGQYLARDAGCTVYNFSKGGMSAKGYCDGNPDANGYSVGFADASGFWNVEYLAQAYIIALGENDISSVIKGDLELGSIADVDKNNYKNNKKTFTGYYAQIIQRYKEIQPRAKFFLMTLPRRMEDEQNKKLRDEHANILHGLAELFENCYVLDFRKYAPEYDEEFHKQFFIGHMTAAGYRLTALMVESYIDYIIRHHMEDFKQIGFVGTPYYNETEKW